MSKSMIKTATTGRLSTGRLRAVLALGLVTILVSTGLFARVRAQDIQPEAAGDLDSSFGTGGKVSSDFGVIASAANGIALQGDGKLVIAGAVQLRSGFDFGLLRLNTDGTLDTSFAEGGGISTDFSGGDDRGLAVALQPDGKIVEAGSATTASGGIDFALARYNTDGTIDTSFGSGGKVTTDFNGRGDRIFAVVVEPNGQILAAGFATTSGGDSLAALALYNSNGSLLGKGTADPGVATMITAMALQSDGKVVLAGSGTRGTGDDFVVARINSDTTSDKSFGNNGVVSTDFGGSDDAMAVAVQPDGKIVAAGITSPAGQFALVRYNTDGSLDSSFGSGGKVITNSLPKPAFPAAVLIQPDNKIVVAGMAGMSSSASGKDFALVRFNTDGSIDSTFGSGGQCSTDFFGSDDGVRTALMQTDGKIVVAGFATHTPGGPPQVAVARYLSGIAPDFSISFDQPTVTAPQGTKARVTVKINRIAGFTGNVTVTPPDPTGGIKPKPADPVTTSDSSAVFKMKVGAAAALGPHMLTFTATDSSGKTRTATVTIVVQ